jgi:hypothetical protein
MKKMRLLSIFFVLMALVLFFPGCEDKSGEGTVGNLYYGFADDGNCVYISILTPANRAVTLLDGDPYAVAVFKVKNGESDWDGKYTSMGKVTVTSSSSSGTKLSFKPGTGYTGSGTGTLNSTGSTLTMEKVPGTSYSLTMNSDGKVSSATAQKPFGKSDPNPPDDDDPITPVTPVTPTNPGTTTDPEPPPTDSTPPKADTYVAGDIVTKIEIIQGPNWGTITYHEGDPVSEFIDGKGMRVMITYNDDKNYTKIFEQNEIKANFVIDPPDFRAPTKFEVKVAATPYKAGEPAVWYEGIKNLDYDPDDQDSEEYTEWPYEITPAKPEEKAKPAIIETTPYEYNLYWKEGFTNEKTTSGLPRGFKLTDTFKGPGGLKDGITSDNGGKLNLIKEWDYDTTAKVLAGWHEDEWVFYEGCQVKVKYGVYDLNAASMQTTGVKTNPALTALITSASRNNGNIWYYTKNNTDFDDLKNYKVTRTDDLTDKKVLLQFGSKTLEFTFPIVYRVKSIELSGTKLNQQVLFDDPRLFGTSYNAAINMHWLHKLVKAGITLTVNYTNGGSKRDKISMERAYNNAAYSVDSDHSFIHPPAPTVLSKAALGFRYYGSETTFGMNVYNRLVSISIDNTDTPIMNYTNNLGVQEEHNVFMNKLKITAIYECEKGGDSRVKRTNPYGDTLGTNKSNDSEFTSSVQEPSFLQRATAAYQKNKGLTTAKVTLTPAYGNGSAKSATIEIGAEGYQ